MNKGAQANLGVHKPEHLARVLLCNSALNKKLTNLFGNTDSRRPGTEKDQLLVLEGDARVFQCSHGTTENDGTSSLNIVIKAGIGISIPL